jgi:hypothetical protein
VVMVVVGGRAHGETYSLVGWLRGRCDVCTLRSVSFPQIHLRARQGPSNACYVMIRFSSSAV